MESKTYFLTRSKEFVEVQLLQDKPRYREVKVLEGQKKNRIIRLHPNGVSWGKLYPRFFEAVSKPTEFFHHNGRVLLKHPSHEETQNLVPKLDENYLFQPQTRDVIDCIIANECTLLTGGGGSGKTTTVEQIANRINQPVLRINFSIETRISDLIGKIQIKDGKTYWTDGVLPYCMKNGIWLILDEIDAADPAILMLLHPVLEDGGKLVLKENNNEVVEKHLNFRIFGTANSIGAMEDFSGSYAGTNKMNAAFIDRWSVILWNTLDYDDELKVLKSKVAGLKHRWAVNMVKFAQDVRSKTIQNYEFPSIFSTRQILKWGKKAALHRSPLKGAKLAWLDKLPESEHAAINDVLNLYFTNKRRSGKIGQSVKK